MNVLMRIRLCLLVLTTMVVSNSYGQYLLINTANLSFNPEAGTQKFNVSSNVNWNITMEGGSDWLTVSPTSKTVSGNDVTEVVVSVSDNTGNSNSRSMTITITGGGMTQTINVTQAGNGYLSASTTQLRFSPEPGTQKFNVSSNVNWNITMEGGNGWLTVSPTSKTVSGNDVTEVTVSALDNTGNSNPRSATITITGGGMSQTIDVTQAGNGYLVASTTYILFSPDGGTQRFSVSSNVNWNISVEGGAGWLTVTPTSKTVNGNDVTEVTVSATDGNTGSSSPRNAIIKISGGNLTQIVKVSMTYDAGYLTVSTTNLAFSCFGGEQKIDVKSSVEWMVSVEGGDGWLTINPQNGSGDGEIVVSATENTNGTSREATINISGSGLLQIIKVYSLGVSGINNMIDNTPKGRIVYNLSGQKVKKTGNMKDLSHGIYIVKGKKIIK